MRVIMFFLFLVAGLMLTAGYFLSREPRLDELERFTFTKKVPIEELEAQNPYAKLHIIRITLDGKRKVSYGDQRTHYEILRDRLRTEAPVTISVGRMKGPIASLFESTINRFLPASTDDDIYAVEIKGEIVLSYDDALDSKQNRSMIALAAGLACLLFSGSILVMWKT
ncbi:MAG: hypothetical protein ACI9UA_002731 [Pseudoalteromonas tetraodonis]|jgi:hypothetical protein